MWVSPVKNGPSAKKKQQQKDRYEGILSSAYLVRVHVMVKALK
jgi:hypothetical protein